MTDLMGKSEIQAFAASMRSVLQIAILFPIHQVSHCDTASPHLTPHTSTVIAFHFLSLDLFLAA
jgi:hypothetical protein